MVRRSTSILFEYYLAEGKYGPMLVHLIGDHALFGRETANRLIEGLGLNEVDLKREARILGDDEALCIKYTCYLMKHLKRYNAKLRRAYYKPCGPLVIKVFDPSIMFNLNQEWYLMVAPLPSDKCRRGNNNA